MRWDTDSSDDKKKNKGPGISMRIKYRILVAFRLLQRCREWSEWELYEEQFTKRVEDIIYDRPLDFEVTDEEIREIDELMKEGKEGKADAPKAKGTAKKQSKTANSPDWSDEDSDADPDYVPEADSGEDADDDDDYSEDGDAEDFADNAAKRARQFNFVMEYFKRYWFTKFWIREYAVLQACLCRR